MDGTERKLNPISTKISSLQKQLDHANAKIEDLENRSRWNNFMIRELPKSVVDLEDTIHILMQDLIPDFSHHLEINRVHRALTALRPNDLPKDVISITFIRTSKKPCRRPKSRTITP